MKKYALILILTAVFLLILALGVKGWRIYQATNRLLALQTDVEALMDGGLTAVDPDTAEQLILDSRRDILLIQSEAAPLLAIAPYLGWLPEVGGLAVAAPALLEMADAGTETAAYAIRGLKPALILLQTDGGAMDALLPDLLRVISDNQADIAQSAIAFERVIAARERIDNTTDLPYRLQTLFTKTDPLLPVAAEGFGLLQTAPALAGMDGTRRYLIIAQNEDELRPTGGFISGAGVLTMENGSLADLQFTDAYDIDDYLNKPYDLPPAPLAEIMGLELFLFRDGNFWPDFPTSAENLIALYSYGQDVPPMDGVIAVDQQFLLLLVEALGEVPLPESAESINAGNMTTVLQEAWAGGRSNQWGEEFEQSRKGFLGYFAAAVQDKLFNDFGSIDPVALGANMKTAADEKHLQIYMRDPAAAATLAALGWDGRLSAPNQDALMVVETNVGFSKTNLLIERQTTYSVDLRDAGKPTAVLTVSYTHHGEMGTAVCEQGASIRKYALKDYLALADECYLTYLRVYTPAETSLTDSSQNTIDSEILRSHEEWSRQAEEFNEQDGFNTFSNLLNVPRGETAESWFAYNLPTAVTTEEDGIRQYQLALYKQAGLHPEPVHLHLQLPDGAELLQSSIAPSLQNDGDLQFDLTLDTDIILTITYRE